MANNGRIVNVSSMAHNFVHKGFLNDLQSTNRYDPWVAYGMSKAANLLFTYELNKRLKKAGSGIISIATHPGYTATNLQKSRFPFWEFANSHFAMSLAEGTQAQLLASFSPDVQASENNYLGPKYGMFGKPAIHSTGRQDEVSMENLWSLSLKITEDFNFFYHYL